MTNVFYICMMIAMLNIVGVLSMSSSQSILLVSDVWLKKPLATPWFVTDMVIVDTVYPKILSYLLAATETIRVFVINEMLLRDVLLFSADDNYDYCNNNNNNNNNDCGYRRWQFINKTPWLMAQAIVGVLTKSPMCHVQPVVPIQHILIQQSDVFWKYDILMFVMLGNTEENKLWHADGRLADLSVAVRSLLRYSTCTFRLHLMIQSEKHVGIFERLFKHPDFIDLTLILYTMTDEISYKLLPDELMTFVNPGLIHSLKKLVLPFVLPTNIKSVLVLDTDIIVVDDLCPILEELSGKSTMFAFAPDVNIISTLPLADIPNIKSLGVLHPQLPAYFTGINGGVILWDLEKTRQVNYDLVWKHAVASYVHESTTMGNLQETKTILDTFFYAGEQYIFDQILRQHREWLTVLPIGMNFTLYVVSRHKNNKYLCKISQSQLHLRILHGTGGVFKNKSRLLSEFVRNPFLDQTQFHAVDYSILGNASGIDLARLARVFLYHDVCLS